MIGFDIMPKLSVTANAQVLEFKMMDYTCPIQKLYLVNTVDVRHVVE